MNEKSGSERSESERSVSAARPEAYLGKRNDCGLDPGPARHDPAHNLYPAPALSRGHGYPAPALSRGHGHPAPALSRGHGRLAPAHPFDHDHFARPAPDPAPEPLRDLDYVSDHACEGKWVGVKCEPPLKIGSR